MQYKIFYNKQDIVEFQKLHAQAFASRWFSPSLGVLFSLTALSLAYEFFQALYHKNTVEVFSLVFALIYLLFSLYLLSRNLRAKLIAHFYMKSQARFVKPFTLTLTKQGIKTVDIDSKAEAKWSSILNYVIGEQLIALYKTPKLAILIPRRLCSKQEWLALTDLVITQVKKQSFKNRNTSLFLILIFLFMLFGLLPMILNTLLEILFFNLRF